jgi:hypothetical protein
MNGFRGSDGKFNEEGLRALCKTLGATSEASKTAANFHTAPSGQVMASNVHVSGYGSGTTTAEIDALFSQYVQVNNIGKDVEMAILLLRQGRFERRSITV